MEKNKNWKWIKVGDVLLTSSGGTPKTNEPRYWQGGDIPWINSGKLKDSEIKEPSNFITDEGLMNSNVKVFPKGTILVALTGSTLGKVGVLGFASGTSQNVTGVYPSKFIKPRFLFYFLIYSRDSLLKRATGAAQPHISKKTIDDILIPLAPISHQNKIIKRIGDAEKSIYNIEKRINKITYLKQSAFEGFIYNGNEMYQSQELKTFCKIRTEKADKNWKGKRLIGVSNTEGIVDLRIGKKRVFENYKLVYPGDFIYNPMRINIGSIAIYEGNDVALTSPDYIVFHSNNLLSAHFLLMFLKSEHGKSLISNNTRGSVRSRLYFSDLVNINIPYCGDKCQEKAEKILSKFQKLSQRNQSLLDNAKQVLKEIFTKAFMETNYRFEPVLGAISADIMKSEKLKLQKKIESSTKKKKNMSKRNTSNKITSGLSIRELIKKEFASKRFSFYSLFAISKLPYDLVRDEVFSLVGNGLILEFDLIAEQMYLKYQEHENPQN